MHPIERRQARDGKYAPDKHEKRLDIFLAQVREYPCTALFARISELEEEYIGFLTDICRIESPTKHKSGVDAVGQYFIDKAAARGSAVVLNVEAGIGRIATIRRKDISRYALTVHGKAMHASSCDKGHSAIREAACGGGHVLLCGQSPGFSSSTTAFAAAIIYKYGGVRGGAFFTTRSYTAML